MQGVKYTRGMCFHRLPVETSCIMGRNARECTPISTLHETILPKNVSSVSSATMFLHIKVRFIARARICLRVRKWKDLKWMKADIVKMGFFFFRATTAKINIWKTESTSCMIAGLMLSLQDVDSAQHIKSMWIKFSLSCPLRVIGGTGPGENTAAPTKPSTRCEINHRGSEIPVSQLSGCWLQQERELYTPQRARQTGEQCPGPFRPRASFIRPVRTSSS